MQEELKKEGALWAGVGRGLLHSVAGKRVEVLEFRSFLCVLEVWVFFPGLLLMVPVALGETLHLSGSLSSKMGRDRKSSLGESTKVDCSELGLWKRTNTSYFRCSVRARF